MKKLLAEIVRLKAFNNDLRELGVEMEELDTLESGLCDFFLTTMGFPEDTTFEMSEEAGGDPRDMEDYYCRDYLIDILWDRDALNVDKIYAKLTKELNALK